MSRPISRYTAFSGYRLRIKRDTLQTSANTRDRIGSSHHQSNLLRQGFATTHHPRNTLDDEKRHEREVWRDRAFIGGRRALTVPRWLDGLRQRQAVAANHSPKRQVTQSIHNEETGPRSHGPDVTLSRAIGGVSPGTTLLREQTARGLPMIERPKCVLPYPPAP